MTPIKSFIGEYRFLSNFWPARVVLDGMEFPTVEHAYQAAKVRQSYLRNAIRLTPSPGTVKRLSRGFKLREGWDDMRLEVMRGLIVQKFQHADLKVRLLSTGTRPLIEGNSWGDTFWGVYNGVGENHLGRILMKVRSEIS